MSLRMIIGLILVTSLTVFLCDIFHLLPYENFWSTVGMKILEVSPHELENKPNIVGAVLYHYRGLDTLGELTVLFTAITAANMILGPVPENTPSSTVSSQEIPPQGGFILFAAADLLFPVLVIFGTYIILYGDIIPGGLFQGGALLAAALFIPILASPRAPLHPTLHAIAEGSLGAGLMVLGLLTLISRGAFLTSLFGETFGFFLWEVALLLLHFAIALKIGVGIAALLARFAEVDEMTTEKGEQET